WSSSSRPSSRHWRRSLRTPRKKAESKARVSHQKLGSPDHRVFSKDWSPELGASDFHRESGPDPSFRSGTCQSCPLRFRRSSRVSSEVAELARVGVHDYAIGVRALA